MSIPKLAASAMGRLFALAILLGAFLFAMASVVYMSLQGAEILVPEITGKSLIESERELASLGLKLKKRAERFSAESPGTVVEQLPKQGETVKTGQLILVVTSKGPGEGSLPANLKTAEEDDTEKIVEMISDKPKKSKANSNSNRKKVDTARDVNAIGPDSATGAARTPTEANTNKREPGVETASPKERPNRNATAPTPARTPAPASRRPSNEPTPRPAQRP